MSEQPNQPGTPDPRKGQPDAAPQVKEGNDGVQGAVDPLARYRDEVIRLLISDRGLKNQLIHIFNALRFTKVQFVEAKTSFVQSAQQLGTELLTNNHLYLVNPPLKVFDKKGKVSGHKDIAEYFANVKAHLNRTGKNEMDYLSRCVPVFPDIGMTQKRENIILSLTKYAIAAAFILEHQESLVGLSPRKRDEKRKEQLIARLLEIKAYLEDYLPHREGALERLLEKKEEQELSRCKAEADKWLHKAAQYKMEGKLEQAVDCYKKAIDVFPSDPMAYLESGRVYIRLHRYPLAFQRFRQAEEVVGDLPRPNKEIGLLRMIQVQERLDQGMDPKAPEISDLLEEAVKHIEVAFAKASKLEPLLQDEDRHRDMEAVNEIASEIFKLDPGSILGKKHPAVVAMRSLARDALQHVAGAELDVIPPAQMICMGLAALDEGRFKEAEDHLFNAVKDKDHFEQACIEINYLATTLRREKSPEEALAMYRKLLQLTPPNRAAVYFNISVALAQAKRQEEAAGAITRAVYMGPALAREADFYRNPQIYPMLAYVVDTFGSIVATADRAKLQDKVIKQSMILEKLERLLRSDNDDRTLKLIYEIAVRRGEFFKWKRVLGNERFVEFINKRKLSLRNSDKPNLAKFGRFLSTVSDYALNATPEASYRTHIRSLQQVMDSLEKDVDQPAAAEHLARAITEYPNCIQHPDFYANRTIINLAREIHTKMGHVDRKRLDVRG